jgi:hypothetical protein
LGPHYIITLGFCRSFVALANQRLKHRIDPAIEIFYRRIIANNQIYVVCAIEPIGDPPNGFLVRATFPKRQSRMYAFSCYLNGTDDAQGRHAPVTAFRDRTKATTLFY